MGDIVEFRSNGSNAQGYLALPDGNGPGVVVIQEWWGLVDHIRDVCDRFAREGFVALAPDLYHGQTTREPDEANKLMMQLQMERATKDMTGAVEFLSSHERVEPRKVGVVGFCMGGGLAVALAGRAPVDAAVPFYPAGASEESFQAVKVPILAHYADHDDFANADEAVAIFEKLREKGLDAEMHKYEGTEHAFFNDTRPEVHDAEAARTAWERTLSFLRKHLA